MKKRRDSTRMATFMNKKDAQNLPFYHLENNELQELSFNSLLRMKAKCHSNCKQVLSDVQSSVNSQAACISFLRTENTDLKVSANVQSKKCLDLNKEIDRVTEKYKRLLEKQKKKTDAVEQSYKEMTDAYKRASEQAKLKVTITEHLETQVKLDKLKLAYTQLEETVKALTMDIEGSRVAPRHKVSRKVISSAKTELMYLTSKISETYYPSSDRKFFCHKCGSAEFHSRQRCPADEYDGTCGGCKKAGHFTLLCKHLGQYVWLFIFKFEGPNFFEVWRKYYDVNFYNFCIKMVKFHFLI